MKPYLIVLIILIMSKCCNKEPVTDSEVSELKCNRMENPIGTDDSPEFSWILKSHSSGKRQSAFQLIIDRERKNIESGKGNICNTGKKFSDQSVGMKYSGIKLEPGKRYYWRVRIWDEHDRASEWSKPAFFVTALFDKSDWDGSEWIGFEDIPDSLILVPGVHGNGDNLGGKALKRTVIPYFRKEFRINKRVKQALVFVCGLGQYELSLNGEKIGTRFLAPGWTDYRKTCLYNTYDVTNKIKSGNNAIGAIVGNGFFNINRERYRKLVIAYGAPRIILKLSVEYEDGAREIIASDETWKTSPSPITYSGIYGGEDYDARMWQKGWDLPGFNDSKWINARIVKEPGGSLKPETDHPVMIMQTIDPVKIYAPDKNRYIYDFGQNASGIIKLNISGNAGQEVKLIPGELLGDDSLVTQRATGEPFFFHYTLKGEEEEIWIPKFTYYGFRYVEVQGAVPKKQLNPGKLPVINKLQFLHTRNSSPVAGSFRCSDNLFNSIYDLINWAVKSNLASVATDCPHREKLGWLEQSHLMGNSIKYIYDIHNLYRKIIDDMIESQLVNGLVPDIAPEYVPFDGGFRDSPEWGSACIILPWDMYSWYGDTNAIRKAYPMMKRYLAYLDTKATDNILSYGLGDWYDLGPDSPGEAQLTPKALTATSIYFYDNILMSEMAKLTGNNEDALYYKNMAEKIRESFNEEFFDIKTKVYSTGSQTSFAMPLFFGMVDEGYREEVVANLVKSINKNGKVLTAGDVGYRYLLRVLESEGYSQLIYEMNSRKDVPGYGYQLSNGATALTESWAALKYVSNNHMMLGHLMEWFYSGIGGIRQPEYSAGYQKIIIAPEIVGDLTWADCSYNSANGEIRCSWKIEEGNYILNVSIPANCTGVIKIPQPDFSKILEDKKPIHLSEEITDIKIEKGKTCIHVISGDYIFITPFQKEF